MSTLSSLPIIDLDVFLADPLSAAAAAEAKKVTEGIFMQMIGIHSFFHIVGGGCTGRFWGSCH